MSDSISGRIVASTTTVTTTSTAIPATAATGRRAIMVYNHGSETVYLGPSTVTTGVGYPLAAGAEKSFDLNDKVILYGRTASDTSDIRSFEGV